MNRWRTHMEIQNKKYCRAIVLSAGQGKRMGTKVQKQYIEIDEKPIIYYTLKAFQESSVIDEIIMVVGEGDVAYVSTEIVEKYAFSKVKSIVEGGKERYDSVWKGLQVIEKEQIEEEESFVFIHDGARMFVDDHILQRGYETVEAYKACVAGMPSKDTVKIVDDAECAVETPIRKYVWTVQTPQIFETGLIIEAYSKLMNTERENVTDDAMVVESMMHVPVKLFEASYENIKLTTPEDLEIAETFLKRKNEKKGEVKSLFPL